MPFRLLLAALVAISLASCIDYAPGVKEVTYNRGRIRVLLQDGIGGVALGSLTVLAPKSQLATGTYNQTQWAFVDDTLKIDGSSFEIVERFEYGAKIYMQPEYTDFEQGGGLEQWASLKGTTKRLIEEDGAFAAVSSGSILYVFKLGPTKPKPAKEAPQKRRRQLYDSPV